MNPVLTETDLEEMVALRRDFHAHPELAFEEVRTSKIVADKLREYGLEPQTGVGKTGVVAMIEGGKPGKTVLLRADMDALPIHEANDVPYRSQTEGKMHACGHDCHTSILLNLSRRLAEQKNDITGRVKLCFQPAEEIGGGAVAMIEDGVLDGPGVDAAFGLHVWQDLDLGKVGVTPGPWMGAVDEFNVTVRGVGAHGAQPEHSADPVVCLSQMITALQTIASRNTNPLLEVVVSVTQIKAGAAFNIIPDQAWMNGTVRMFDDDVWNETPKRFERICRGVAAAFGCEVDVEYIRHNRPTVNDPDMAAIAREAAVEVVGEENVVDDLRTLGGEDFSDFLAKVPGCFIAIGSRNESKGLVWGHHHPRFDVDEGSLGIGAQVLLRTAQKFLER